MSEGVRDDQVADPAEVAARRSEAVRHLLATARGCESRALRLKEERETPAERERLGIMGSRYEQTMARHIAVTRAYAEGSNARMKALVMRAGIEPEADTEEPEPATEG